METFKIYSEKELAEKLMVSPWTIRLWRMQLDLPYFRTARRIFYRLDSVVQWMDAEEHRNAELSKCELIQEKVKRIAQ